MTTTRTHQEAVATADDRPLVVNVSDWRGDWFAGTFPEIRWEYHSARARNRLERTVRKPNLARLRCGWEAMRSAVRRDARLIITHDPRLAFRCAAIGRMLGRRVPQVAWSFNFVELPRDPLRRAMARAFREVDRFIVASSLEKRLYAEYFDIPDERLDLLPWSVGEPEIDAPGSPIVPGDYLCALGGNGRDYRTLLGAMALLPDIRLALVARPQNLVGLSIPPNVQVFSGIPVGAANNILLHSRFMALPLAGSEVPCGHITIVSAMKLGRASIVTESAGLSDYVREGETALSCEAGSVESLAARIRELWDDPGLARVLGQHARTFAAANFTEQATIDKLRGLFREFCRIA